MLREATLWKAAGTFRGSIDAANYKDYILTMLFLKYLDDTYKENLRDLEKKYCGNEVRIERAKKNLPFVLADDQRFDYLYENRFDPKIGDSIAWGDTLSNPQHLDSDGNLKQFDVIVANMPFSLDKWAEGFNRGGQEDGSESKDKKFKMTANLDPYHRFDWGVPPASKGDTKIDGMFTQRQRTTCNVKQSKKPGNTGIFGMLAGFGDTDLLTWLRCFSI